MERKKDRRTEKGRKEKGRRREKEKKEICRANSRAR